MSAQPLRLEGCDEDAVTGATSTTLMLVRHGHTDAVGHRLAGRMAHVHLSDVGLAQAGRLPLRLHRREIAAIYASPMERARETAGPLAAARDLDVVVREELNEVDFGAWTGRTFEDLALDPAWQRFNTYRSAAAVPGGERAIDVQSRAVPLLDDLRSAHPSQTIVAVSHSDVIRALVLHCIGAPLDMIHRLAIAPASVTTLALYETSATLLALNERDQE